MRLNQFLRCFLLVFVCEIHICCSRLLKTNRRRLGCQVNALASFAPSVTPDELISFMVMGDIPYSIDERYCLNQHLRDLDLSPTDGPRFLVHVGDIREGAKNKPCDEESYNDIAEIFTHPDNTLNYDPRDVLWVVGDNEWLDCRNTNHSWSLWTKHFGPQNPYGFGTFSSPGINLERQTDVERLPGVDRSENFAFFTEDILFVGLNIIGGRDFGDEPIRLMQNFRWVRAKLDYYSQRNMKAMVIFAHATLKEGVRRDYFGNSLWGLLRDRYPNLPVMFVHGDGHDYCIRYPDRDNPNFVDVMVDAGGYAPPIKVSLLGNPRNSTEVRFDIDRMGGDYYPLGACPKAVQQTWDSPGSPVSDPSPTPQPAARSPTSLPPLVTFNKPKRHMPLGNCEGDCDNDDECDNGLTCFKRRRAGFYDPVPGCSGLGVAGKDYCVSDTFPTSPTPSSPSSPTVTVLSVGELAYYGSPKENPDRFPLGVCEGDCDGDGQCARGLKCFQRSGTEPVPGCKGKGKSGKDYCYDPRGKGIVIPTTPSTVSPTLPPTTSPTLQPTILSDPELTIDNSSYPLGQCIGDCDRDNDCEVGLLCFKRSGFEPVPGCSGSGVEYKDYCYAPPDDVLVELGNDGVPAEAYPLGRCRGDCDYDSDCMPGLTCFTRKDDEPVPGCSGEGISGVDYCIPA